MKLLLILLFMLVGCKNIDVKIVAGDLIVTEPDAENMKKS